MSELLGKFVEKKKAESNFLSLEDGESVRVLRLQEIKAVTKAGYGGEEKDVLRFKCLVETSEGQRVKDFDNGTQRFAQELQDKNISIGSSFVITRNGESTKTRYTISEVVNPTPVAAPAPAPAPAPEVVPVAEVGAAASGQVAP
jgi:hypothetical protein